MFTALINACKSFLNRVKDQLKKITKPATASLATGAITDLPKNKADLMVENAILRQQLREATPWGEKPKYLIRDNDGKYGARFKELLKNSGIEEKKTPPCAPRANAICERFIGSLRREALDHMLFLHQHQLRRVVKEFVDYYNRLRPHQGIDQRIPTRFVEPRQKLSNKPKGLITVTPVLNGLHHHYAYAGLIK